ncbi:MAG TPA: hypothetical protein VFA11_11635 [Acidimicrobiales bacterium]|nr:hypothetical protein [Acidimicrobiales bacterium]
MRKILTSTLVGAVVVGGLALSAGVAGANSSCGSAGVNPSYTDAAGNSGVQVCTNGTPVQGTVTAAGSASTATGYVVADGSPSNSGALSGYIGADNKGIVGCSSGDYTPGATDSYTPASGQNNAILLFSNPTGAPAPGSSGPCAVSAP